MRNICYSPEALRGFSKALWDDGGTLTQASRDGLCDYADTWEEDLKGLRIELAVRQHEIDVLDKRLREAEKRAADWEQVCRHLKAEKLEQTDLYTLRKGLAEARAALANELCDCGMRDDHRRSLHSPSCMWAQWSDAALAGEEKP